MAFVIDDHDQTIMVVVVITRIDFTFSSQVRRLTMPSRISEPGGGTSNMARLISLNYVSSYTWQAKLFIITSHFLFFQGESESAVRPAREG